MTILYDQSDEYYKEKAVKLQDEGKFPEALEILVKIYNKQEPETHGYANDVYGAFKSI